MRQVGNAPFEAGSARSADVWVPSRTVSAISPPWAVSGVLPSVCVVVRDALALSCRARLTSARRRADKSTSGDAREVGEAAAERVARASFAVVVADGSEGGEGGEGGETSGGCKEEESC
jgi:hypothetical protein